MKPLFSIDGRSFHVGVTALERMAKVADGPSTGMLRSGRIRRDIIGTYYSYRLEISTFDMGRAEYDELYEILTAPEESHIVTVPYGQGVRSFEAYITDVEDMLEDKESDDSNSWGGLSVTFYALEPQREG